ncbi:MAG: alanine racemase [Gallionellaceae bacterium]|jgi:alanine racemase|nr:alanine racemase [Gallionellaceae bacterium]
MPRPIQARISLSALEHNLGIARSRTRARVMSVIKAGAYGHGLLRAAEALRATDGYALLDINDAVLLRDAGYRHPVLLLEGCFTPDDFALAVRHDLACVIHNAEQLAMLDACPQRGALDVWLKINSGMNRLGFAPQAAQAAMEKLKAHPAVRNVTLMTHFANADEATGVSAQLEAFNALTAAWRAPRSLANSAALLRYPETHGDWVRPGIMLYGASPFAEMSAQSLGLQAAMTLSSEIIAVQTLRSGDAVGYGGTFRADAPMRVGTVACGYADGYPRHAPTGTPILVNGRRTRTLGRVSMDMLAVDLSGMPEAGIGSPVVLWGDGLPVEEVAAAAGTISYELLCALAPRVSMVVG